MKNCGPAQQESKVGDLDAASSRGGRERLRGLSESEV